MHKLVNSMIKLRELVLLILLWGSFAAASALTMDYIDPFQLLCYMFGIAWAVMTIWLFRKRGYRKLWLLTGRDWLQLSLYAVPSFLYYVCYLSAMNYIPVMEATMLNYLFPLMIVLWAVPLNGESLSRGKLLALLCGFVGMALIVTDGSLSAVQLSDVTGDALAIAAAVLWGLFSNLVKRNRNDSWISNYIYVSVSFGLALLLVVGAGAGGNIVSFPGWQPFAGLLWISLSNVVAAYWLWARVLRNIPLATVANMTFLTPFVSLMFIALLLGATFSYAHAAGLVLILLGVFVVRRQQ